MYSVLNTLSEHTYQKTSLHTLVYLFLKSLKAFSVSLINEESTVEVKLTFVLIT